VVRKTAAPTISGRTTGSEIRKPRASRSRIRRRRCSGWTACRSLAWKTLRAAASRYGRSRPGRPPGRALAHLGIDEHRRGRARFAADEQTGEYTLLADRWHTCFFDLDGNQGLLGQVQGRTADDAAYWLAGATPAWRDEVQVVCIDLCSIYAAAVRRMLPGAVLAVDLFHVVQLAAKAVGDVPAGSCAPGTGGAAAPATPSTASRACWCGTWST
jgi:hypothetical protein